MKKHQPRAGDIMERHVVFVRPEDSLAQAYATLREAKVSGAPVVSAHEGLVGVVSQTDLMNEAFASDLLRIPRESYYIEFPFTEAEIGADAHHRLEHTPVKNVMNRRVVTVSPDHSLSEVAQELVGHGIHRVIVVNGTDVLGVISSLGLLKAFMQEKE